MIVPVAKRGKAANFEGMDDSPYNLLVFADDWGRHPSSCQHLIKQLLPRYSVFWVNTIGMRAPALNIATIGRGVEKLGHWLSKRPRRQALPENLQVASPRMWPWFRRRHDRWINRHMLVQGLAPLVHSSSAPWIAITTIPVVADLIGRLPVDRWVYYCVDDFSVWPGLDQRTMNDLEEKLIPRVDVLIAASEALRSRLHARGRQSELLTHGVDLDDWRSTASAEALPSVASLERPVYLFWGLIDPRMDTAMIRRLAEDIDSGTVVLAGPMQAADADLFRMPRVVHHAAVPQLELPRLAAGADVLIMPYQDLPVTRAMQPLKLKEYLASQKAVVARDLPATREWSDCLDLVSSAENFSIVARHRAKNGLTSQQRIARSRLESESWEAKARQFERFILAGLAGGAAQ